MAKWNAEEMARAMHREPINPIGECFDSAAQTFVADPDLSGNARLCHGIGVANAPGEEGNPMGHAWIEWTHADGVRVACDTTWGLQLPAADYRRMLQLTVVRTYSRALVIQLWKQYGTPGPWDPEIKALVEER